MKPHRQPWLIAIAFVLGLVLPGVSVAQETSTSQDQSEILHSVGPWGTLEAYTVVLEPPATHLWSALFDERSYWNFGVRDKASILSLLRSFHLTEETMALIESEGKWIDSPQGLELDLTDAIIESIRPEDRTALAKWFRLNSNDYFSKMVINFEGGDFEAFNIDAISPSTIDAIKRMSFKRRNILSLMDRAYVLRHIKSLEEKNAFIHAAFANRALLASLVIDDSSDIDGIIKYWSAGGMNRGIESIIRGVAATSGVTRLDLVQILPPVPRRYLYGYTNLVDVGPNNTPDCFWAAIQFFRRKATPRLLDNSACAQHLEEDFVVVDGPAQFGDIVVMYKEEDNSFLHAYVQIADDIVFTKNGTSYARPFILTRKKDMLSVYLDETPHIDKVYRRKSAY